MHRHPFDSLMNVYFTLKCFCSTKIQLLKYPKANIKVLTLSVAVHVFGLLSKRQGFRLCWIMAAGTALLQTCFSRSNHCQPGRKAWIICGIWVNTFLCTVSFLSEHVNHDGDSFRQLLFVLIDDLWFCSTTDAWFSTCVSHSMGTFEVCLSENANLSALRL